MKKQLIIAAIACAVSGAAFAAPPILVETPTQDVDINFSIDSQPPTLTLEGSIFTAGSASTSLDFDEDQRDSNTIRKTIGTVSMHADNYSSTYSGTCKIEITADNNWALIPTDSLAAATAGAPASIRYGVAKLNNAISYGYSTQAGGNLVTTGISKTFQGTAGAPKNCHLDETLEVVIDDLPRPTISGLPVGSSSVQYAGTMTLKGTVQ